jgi:hypothetical protein
MQVLDMNLVHHLKQGPTESVCLSAPHLFHLDTCQRQLWITDQQPDTTHHDINTYMGEAAYEKLLAIACGLESRVIGETEVFAQLKNAWREHHDSSQYSDSTDAVLTGLFEDTKFIRSNYLTGLGGQSYGTLIRKLLEPSDDSHFLIVGAGELASGIAPLLTRWRLTLTNRSMAKACKLADSLNSETSDIAVLSPASANLFGTHLTVTDIIVCRPFDAPADQRLARLPMLRNFVHLGASQQDLAALSFTNNPDALGLDDIFALQATQDELRKAQVTRARRACKERAILRSLGASVTLPHGWEDLAAFG